MKETFPNHKFEHSSTNRSIHEASSDGEALETLWNTATVTFVDGRPVKQADRIQALLDVSSLISSESVKS